MNKVILNTQTSYDQVAVEYAERFKNEMDDKPSTAIAWVTLRLKWGA